jgi:hypothetical protein
MRFFWLHDFELKNMDILGDRRYGKVAIPVGLWSSQNSFQLGSFYMPFSIHFAAYDLKNAVRAHRRTSAANCASCSKRRA